MQESSSAAELIRQMFRQESHHASAVEPTEKHRRRRPAWRREVRPEAVLDARRPVWRSSWAPGELSGGRLQRLEALWGGPGRREARPASKPVRRPSGPPGSQVAVLLQNVSFAQPSGGPLGVRRLPPRGQNASVLQLLLQNAGFAQAAAGGGAAAKSQKRQSLTA